MSKKYLIVGGGIAGLSVSWQLQKQGISFQLIDQGINNSSSKIAAGMFNPVSGKRMTVSAEAHHMLASLDEMMQEMEALLQKKLYVKAPILQAFGNVKEANDFSAHLDRPSFATFVDANPSIDCQLEKEFGYFQVNESGWVKTVEWIEAYQNYLEAEGKFTRALISYDGLKEQDGKWTYANETYEGIIFCEGSLFSLNPYFHWLPFKLCKGQVLLIHCPGLDPSYILKRGVYLVHQYEDVYKVGATYEWEFENALPTADGLNQLLEKLKQMISLPFEVLDHYAGIRPTTRDRGAILGEHPEKKNLFVFNGLGTKGMLQAPLLAKNFVAFLQEGTAIPKQVSVQRFLSFYSNGQ